MRFFQFKELTRLEQSLFGLPFLISGALLGWSHALYVQGWLWVLPAFILARISGMAFNQLVDRHIDALNPRTKGRLLPSGRISVNQVRTVAWGALLVFVIVCCYINTVTALLAPLAAFLLYIYSYMKRIHASCHLVLGAIHFLSPVMAAAALCGKVPLASLFLGGTAFLAIAASDIVYAIQDYDFDCTQGLLSIPVRLGIRSSYKVAALLHLLTPFMLIAVGISEHFPFFYYLIFPSLSILLVFFHLKLRRDKKFEQRFAQFNLAIGFSALIFIGLSLLWRVML